MNAIGMVAATVMLATSTVTAADLANDILLPVNARQEGAVPLAEIASRVELLAEKRFEGESLSLVREELSRVWNYFSPRRAVNSDTAARLDQLWQSKNGAARRDSSASLLKEEVTVLAWQTYHCLFAERHPLSVEDQDRKAVQFRKLRTILAEVDDQLAARNAKLPGAMFMGVRDEAQRSIDLLKECFSSPAYPVFYYPLSDQQFEKAVTSIEARVQKLVENMLSQRPREPQFPSMANGVAPRMASDRAKWFQTEVKLEQKGNVLSALTMGSIVRHYGMLERKLDYGDSQMFPFWKVNGFGLGYSMGEGISIRIGLDETLTPAQ